MSDKPELGAEAKDSITGFKGIITGHAEYITGCDQYLLTPKVSEVGKLVESGWYDENRVIVNKKNVPPVIEVLGDEEIIIDEGESVELELEITDPNGDDMEITISE